MPWQRGRSTRDQAKPANWAAVRRAVLERDGYRCQLNGPRCTITATHVDHTDQSDGPWDTRLHVLRSLCSPCHMARTARQAHATRPPLRRPAGKHPGLL